MSLSSISHESTADLSKEPGDHPRENAILAKAYFVKNGMNKVQCKCGSILTLNHTEKKKNKEPIAYNSAMITHIKMKHDGSWQKVLEQAINEALKDNHKMDDYLIMPTAEVSNIYKWMDWIIACDLSLSAIENPKFREYSSLQPICVKTLKKHMGRLLE